MEGKLQTRTKSPNIKEEGRLGTQGQARPPGRSRSPSLLGEKNTHFPRESEPEGGAAGHLRRELEIDTPLATHGEKAGY